MSRWRTVRDKLFVFFVLLLSIIALAPLIHMIIVIFVRGIEVIAKAGLSFFLSIPPTPLSRDIGGIAPAFVGSFITTLIAIPITMVLSLSAAILSIEFPQKTISRSVDILCRSFASIPTIIISMVVYSVVVVPMGRFSALAGAIALALISIPYAYTAFSSALRSVPQTYREASYSIGMNRWQAILKVFIPIAKKAIVVGILITFARAMGETATLLFTIGRYRAGVSLNVLAPTDAIPLLIFDFITSPFRIYHEVAWGASFVLFVVYLVIFIAVKIVVKEVKL